MLAAVRRGAAGQACRQGGPVQQSEPGIIVVNV